MRGRVITCVAAALALGAPSAAEALTIDGGTPELRAQITRWVNKNRMPDPAAEIHVIAANCPDDPTFYASCTTADYGAPIYLRPDIASYFSFYHEVGHRFSFEVMTGPARRRFERIMRYGSHWTEAVELRFADAYAACASGMKAGRPRLSDSSSVDRFPTANNFAPSREQYARVCALIVDTAHPRG